MRTAFVEASKLCRRHVCFWRALRVRRSVADPPEIARLRHLFRLAPIALRAMGENAAMAELEQQRILKTAIPGPRSLELMARKTGAVARGVGTTMPVFAVEAGGGVVVDVDGNSLIDFGSGIAVTTIGNSAPRVVAAVKDQVEQFTHTCFMITPYEGYVAVAEQLNRLTPGNHEKRSALFNSGAEAVENAVKIARAYTKKQAVVAFDHAYHGRTNLAMALTAKSMPYKHSFGPFAPEVYRAPLSYPYRDDKLMDGELAARRAIDVIDKQVGPANLAAVIIEPIQGEGGFIVPADGFLPALAEWCRANDVVFIADEIQTGFARTGAMFASELFEIVPDLIVTAKGIAGGLPLAAVTGRIEIMDAPHVGGSVGRTEEILSLAPRLSRRWRRFRPTISWRVPGRSSGSCSPDCTVCRPMTTASGTFGAAARWSPSSWYTKTVPIRTQHSPPPSPTLHANRASSC